MLHDSPDSLIAVIVAGARLPSTATEPSPLAMPSFGWRYSDAEIADLANFVRSAWGNSAASVSAIDVRRVRSLALDAGRER